MKFALVKVKKNNKNMKIIDQKDSAYSLLELIITIFIMGMILLVVNVVLVSTIRVSQEADARIKIRQGVESAYEVIRRNIKSGNSNSVVVYNNGEAVDPAQVRSGDSLSILMSETNSDVRFYLEDGVVKASWGSGRVVNLTSSHDLSVTDFSIDVSEDPESGSAVVLLTIIADSISSGKDATPVIEGFLKQATIVCEGQDT